MPAQETLPIFPLNTVLFPGGMLPLKIFEQRYLDMSTICLRDNRPFGVCLIKDGNEVGVPALPEPIGCTAAIMEWDMQQLGVLHLKTEGVQRFRILNREVTKNGLISAEIKMLAADQQTPLSPELRVCATVLKLSRSGAVILPANPGFYHHPASVKDLVDFVVARILDHLGIPHQLSARWGNGKPS